MIRILVIAGVVLAGILALAGGPVVWAILVMIGVPFVFFFLLGAAGHESAEHPHFAPPRTGPRV